MARTDAPPLYWSDDIEDAGSPDLAIRSPMQDGTTVALREVILHMVEEYARHLGHADLPPCPRPTVRRLKANNALDRTGALSRAR